jgi:hypothetical protein
MNDHWEAASDRNLNKKTCEIIGIVNSIQ